MTKSTEAHKILTAGREAITAEAEALSYLSNSLDENFVTAVRLLSEKNNHIIVSGIGKSGHIARKIAATFSSVGQPAFFVHPAEASHGDLGMITPQDRLLLLSHSGETAELKSLLDYSRRFHIPLVAITAKENSNLASVADVTLCYPMVSEACPMGLAPTTSTTIMLALGDALAIATLRIRNFSPTDFRTFHPGGNLGKQLSRVGDFMHTGDRLPILAKGTLMNECLIKISYFGFGCIAIINNQGLLEGIITDGDLRRHMHEGLLTEKVEDVMNPNPIVISADILMAEALAIMQEKSITSLFIGADQKPIGLLHIHDCLRAGII
ncbi:MAG: SIS domain-containing protein [Pseudomonadota bacterium]|jgi:arabinose-5-phosphate isomerase|nr:KpsF/GutQ family sugar-phosphate isomerase [Alphaproteobacteria bacterium]